MKRRISIILLTSIVFPLFQLFFPFNAEPVAEAAGSSLTATPPGPVGTQTLTIPVEANAPTNGGVMWSQLDNGSFRASITKKPPIPDQEATTGKGGTKKEGDMLKDYPEKGSLFHTILDTSRYQTSAWKDSLGKEYPKSAVTNMELNKDKLEFIDALTYEKVGKPRPWSQNPMFVEYDSKTGGPNWTENTRYGSPGEYKFIVNYATPMMLYWKGEVKQTKSMRMQPVTVGEKQTKQAVAEIETKNYAAANWTNVTGQVDQSSWKSDNTAIATIDKTGKVTGVKKGTTTIHGEWKQGGYHLKASATVTVTTSTAPPDPEPTPEPEEYVITGNFDILPSQTIEWRDSFTFHPRDFKIPPQCTYTKHRYLIERDGNYSLSNYVTSQTADTTYTYSSYPDIIGIGTHMVSLRIFAKCQGKDVETGWLGQKDLNVNGPVNNNPPIFNAGWFPEYDRFSWEAPNYIVVNSRVNLRIINEPEPIFTPARPYDPDGDPITYTWDFANSTSSWVQSLPDKYGLYKNDEMHTNILADELGRQCARVTGRDPFGAATTRNVCVDIVPENPVPIINAPNEVVEGRPLKFPIDGDRSYSPMKRPLVKYDWTNKHDRYMTPGVEKITLEVTDSVGLKSLNPAVHNLTVKEDLPPVPKLDFDEMALRTTPVIITNTSYSPDNDEIVENVVSYKYDSDNDGSFADEASVPVTFDELNIFSFKPPKVGKYRFHVYVKEDWGKDAQKDFDLTVVNDNPVAEFTLKGEIEQPPGATPIALTPSALIGGDWKSFAKSGEILKRFIQSGNSLVSGNTHITYPYGNYYFDPGVSRPSKYLAPSIGATKTDGNFDEVFKFIFGDDASIGLRKVSDEIYNNHEPQLIKNGTVAETTLTSITTLEEIKRMNSSWASYMSRGEVRFYNSYMYDACRRKNDDGSGYSISGNYYHKLTINSFGQVVGSKDWNTSSGNCSGDDNYKYNLSGSYHYMTTGGWGATGTNMYDPEFAATMEVVSDPGGAGRYTYSFSRYLNNKAIYKVSLPASSVETGVSYGSYILPKVFPVSPDGKKVAHLLYDGGKNTALVIRNNTNGAQITSKVILTSNSNSAALASIIAYWDNRIIVFNGSTFQAYDFNLNLVWDKSPSELQVSSIANIQNYGIVSKDGYLMFLEAPNGGGPHGSHNFYFKMINLIDGTLTNNLFVANYSIAYGQRNNTPILTRPVLYGDGRVAITTGYSYDQNDCDSSERQCSYRYGYSNTIMGDFYPIDDRDRYNIGQIYNPNLEQIHAEYAYSLKLPKTLYRSGETAGFSFRIKDMMNMYRIETDQYATRIVKIENGVRTVLSELANNTPLDTWKSFKIRNVNGKIKVYINGVPRLEVNDKTFTSGHFGPYAEKESVEFTGITYAPYEIDEMDNVALVDSPVTYDTTWTDPEDDPQLKQRTSWDFEHTNPNKFLDAGDGKSGLSSVHNKTVDSPILSFDRVGMFKVTYRGSDDPHPDYRFPSMTFDSYRQFSDDYWQTIAVHRRPIAQFTLSVDPTTKKVVWNDTSYDPDRWLSPSNYSSEATGIDYRNTRGITKRMYYSISPSGDVSSTQLISPREAGIYTVGESVRDEYNAWSDWYEQQINITQPIIDEPPVPGFNLSKTTLNALEQLTITSTAYDKEDGPAEFLPHKYYIRNLTTGTAETLQSTDRGTWTKAFSSLGEFEIRQVVTDSVGQSAQLIKKVEVVNTPPVADFDWTPKPVWEEDNINLINLSTDADNDPLTYNWTIVNPNGVTTTSTLQSPTITKGIPGTYVVTLTVRDPIGAQDTITKNIVVQPNVLTGYIKHIPTWITYYNKEKLSLSNFMAGEPFDVSADTSENAVQVSIHFAFPIAKVEVPKQFLYNANDNRYPNFAYTFNLLGGSSSWRIEAWRKYWIQIPDGTYNATMTSTYKNGSQKTQNFSIVIKDHIWYNKKEGTSNSG